MRIARIEIGGFGCLRDFREDVAPGVHIFHGPNESGKSTLQQSIFALLYGFYESDRARRSENAARERFVPWSGGEYSAQLEYELENGHRYRVHRDFSSSDVPTALWDLVVGRDMTDDFGRGRHGNVPFARRQLGMTKRVFDACAFMSQGELFEIAEESRASPQEIGDTIISLADTARRDVSAQAAIDRLERVLRERVGTSRARAAPLPIARRRLEDTKRELQEVDRVRGEVADDAARVDEASDDARELREAISRSRYLLLQAEAADLENRISRIEALDQNDEGLRQAIATNASFAEFPADERDNVLRKWASIVEIRERLGRDQTEVEQMRTRLAVLQTQKEALARGQRELAHLQDYPVDRKNTIDELVNLWRDARTLTADALKRVRAAEVAEGLIEEYNRLEPKVGKLSREDLELLTQRLRAPSAGWLRRVLRAVARAVVATLRWVWKQIVLLARWALRRVTPRPTEPPLEEERAPKESEESVQAESLGLDEPVRILEQHRRYLEIAPLVGKYEEAREAAEVATSEVATAAQQVCQALEGLVDDLSEPEVAYGVFCERVDGLRELESAAVRLEQVDGERSALLEAVERFEGDQDRLGRLESGLGEQLRQATGKAGPLEELIEAFEESCRRKHLHDDAERGLRESDERRGIILEGRSPSELEEALRRARVETERLLADNPLLAGARTSETPEALEQIVKQQGAHLNECELSIRELRTRIDTRLAGLRPRAELEEEIERYQRDVSTLESFGEELTIAIDVIGQAMTEAHRDFAPSVGRFLSDGLARVTGGRYERALLDPATLRLTAEVPETRRLEDVEMLSRGTRAAAYLLLRIGLAQHMSALGEPVPLILDDTLVDLDDVRAENFLDLLLDLATQVQILLFTKHQGTKAWFESRCRGNPHHRLTSLPAPGTANSPSP